MTDGYTRRAAVSSLAGGSLGTFLGTTDDSALTAPSANNHAQGAPQPDTTFIDVSLAAAETAVSTNTIFRLVSSTTGLVDVRKRTAGGSDLLFQEATAAALSAANGSTLIGFLQAGADAVTRTVEAELRDRVNVKQFGAKCDRITCDAAAVQQAVEYCLTNNKDLEISGMACLSNSINIDHLVGSSQADNYFTIWSGTGGGFIVKSNIPIFSTNLINDTDKHHPVTQMVRFVGLKFEADTNTREAYVLDSNKFLRIIFDSCNFRKIKCLYAPSGKHTQTITFQNCQARRWLGVFFRSKEITFDLKVLGGLWEAGGDAFDIDYPVGCAFIGANIEGMENYAIKYSGGYGLSITGCYFEENGNSNAEGTTIDGSLAIGARTSENVMISGNYFAGTANTPDKAQIRWGDTATATSIGNLCTTTLHQFSGGSRVNVIGDYARTSLSNTDPILRLQATGNQAYGGAITQSFISGRGGLLQLRSLQDNTPSGKGITIDEIGNAGLGTDTPLAENHTHLGTSEKPRHYFSNGVAGQEYGGFFSGFSVEGRGGYAAIGTMQAGVFSEAIVVDAKHNIYPAIDGAQSLGSPEARFENSYFRVSPIVTSDEREKHWRGGLNPAELRAARRIIGELGIYQWIDAREAKGDDGARLHFGVRAQRAFAILEAEGLDWRRYAWACHDHWDAQTEAVMEEITVTKPRTITCPSETIDEQTGRPSMGKVKETNEVAELQPTGETRTSRPAGDRYGVRTDQLAFWLIAAQAALQADLEARLTALENPA